MRLADRTDYALRVMMLLAATDGRHSVAEMSRWFGVSANHLAKVVQALQDRAWVRTTRGRSGGVELGDGARAIPLGQIVRAMEPDLDLVACFRDDGACPLFGSCGLWGALHNARRAFLSELDRVSLADAVHGYQGRLLALTTDSTS